MTPISLPALKAAAEAATRIPKHGACPDCGLDVDFCHGYDCKTRDLEREFMRLMRDEPAIVLALCQALERAEQALVFYGETQDYEHTEGDRAREALSAIRALVTTEVAGG